MHKFFIYYDDEDRITAISNEIQKGLNYYECDANLVLDFISGARPIDCYKVKLQNNKDVIFEKIDNVLHIPVFNDVYILPLTPLFHDYSLQLVYESNKKYWKINASSDLLKNIQENEINIVYKFFICDKEDYNILYRRIDLQIKDLLLRNIIIPFSTEAEKKFESLCVISKKYVDNIGLVYV